MLGAIAIVALGSLVWTFAIASGVMSRNFDGGIFLSTSAGLRHGISLYSGVWDNKDPLFFVVMSGAGAIHPVLAFVLDWFWLAVASFGAYLIANRVTSSSIAIFIGVVVTPFLLIGPAYVPGITSLPGSAALLLALGLLQ